YSVLRESQSSQHTVIGLELPRQVPQLTRSRAPARAWGRETQRPGAQKLKCLCIFGHENPNSAVGCGRHDDRGESALDALVHVRPDLLLEELLKFLGRNPC